jgi:hypothetical protein
MQHVARTRVTGSPLSRLTNSTNVGWIIWVLVILYLWDLSLYQIYELYHLSLLSKRESGRYGFCSRKCWPSCAFVECLRTKWQHTGTHLLMNLQKSYAHLVTREDLYNVIFEFVVYIKLKCIEMQPVAKCGRANIFRIHLHEELSEWRRCSIASAFQPCFRVYPYKGSGKSRGTEMHRDTSAACMCW